MPAGMELFPATDDTAWQLIRDIIDASDYYVLIIAGRYGSLDEAGIGYTEKEYDYAIKTNKPVIPLLHKNPDNLPRDKTETDELIWKRLKAFRAKVEKKHTCVYWATTDDLKSRVIVGLTAAIKRHPAIGWVKADQVPSDATLNELLKLKSRISELEKEASDSRLKPPTGTEELMQDNDRIELHCEFVSRVKKVTYPYNEDTGYTGVISPTWNQIFAAVSPCMINEVTVDDLMSVFKKFLKEMAVKEYSKIKKLKGTQLITFEFKESEIEICIIQLRALGLIIEGKKQRSLKDTSTYWTLTPYGDTKMVQLIALRKKTLEEYTPTTAEKQEK